MNPTISHSLAEFVANTKFAELNSEVVCHTRYALLDALGVSLAAIKLGEGCAVFRQHVLVQEATPQSRVWGSGKKSSPSLAAFANGALSHALDFEDTHDAALVHPNAAVIPAALAVAEAKGDVSGKTLLTAIAVGCEIVCRLGLALTVPMDKYGWYPPPILSTFGAAAAAAHIYQLNAQQVLDAFSLALLQATCSGEIKYNPDSVIRAVRDAFPSQAGVITAQLAQQGVKGFQQPFEGEAGFFASYARGGYAPHKLTDNLGKEFAIAQLSFKLWPSCRGTHVFVDLLDSLLRENNLRFDEIEKIVAYGNGINRMLAEPIQSKQQPRTSIDAKFSIPYCLAWTAVHGTPTLTSFLSESLSDVAVINLAKKVSYQVDDTLTDSGSGMLHGRLVLTTQDKREFTLSGASAPGSLARPLTESQLLEKFLQCCLFLPSRISNESAQKLADSILNLDNYDDLNSALFQFL